MKEPSPRITVVTVSGHVQRAKLQLGIFPWASTFRWYDSALYFEIAAVEDKGITWIEGWPEFDSDEARALLAAWKLRRSAA